MLSFDRKKDAPSGCPRDIEGVLDAVLFGGQVVVPSAEHSESLIKQGSYGQIIGDRQDRVALFVEQGNHSGPEKWKEMEPCELRLRLSCEEAIFLSICMGSLSVHDTGRILNNVELWNSLKSIGGRHFVKRCALYRHLRTAGWVVRSGLPFGCCYLVYRDGPEYYHASAGVLIVDSMEPRELVAVNRALTNVKKAAFLAVVNVPDSLDLCSPTCLEGITVEMTTSSAFFVERHLGSDLDSSLAR